MVITPRQVARPLREVATTLRKRDCCDDERERPAP